jgi:hypothetical protein
MATGELRVEYDIEEQLLESLGQILGVTDQAALGRELGQLARAALEEYVLAFAGERSPTAVRDLRELRLTLLYKHLPEGTPNDQQVAELFQLTPTQAAGLIAGARARYRNELERRLRAEAWAAIGSGEGLDKGGIRIEVSDSLGTYIKDLIRRTTAAQPRKSRDSSRKYDLTRTTRKALERQLGDRLSGVGPGEST